MKGKTRQTAVKRKKLNVTADPQSLPDKGGHVQIMSDELVAKLEEVDRLIREEIRSELDSASRDSFASSRLACLMRSRADVQSAITCLLGASH